jgi:hypothetical protein
MTSRARALVIPLVAAVLTYALWSSVVLFPLKIFTVFLHELSHGLAAVATGGSIVRIELSIDEGGVCWTRGGSPLLVASAGYLGSLGWGALFLCLAAWSRHDRAVVGAIGVGTLGVTLAYVRTPFGLAYGIVTGLALMAVAAWLPDVVSDVLLRVVGTVSALYAVWDIASDVLFRSLPASDASALARLTGVPAVVWGILWTIASLAVLVLVLRATVRRA